MEKNEVKIYEVWTNLLSLYSRDPQWAPAITSSCIGARSLKKIVFCLLVRHDQARVRFRYCGMIQYSALLNSAF